MLNSYEENGKFYFEDEQEKVETTELIDCDLVVYDENQGYFYNGKRLDEYIKYSHGGYRPGSGAKKTLPDGATRKTINATDAEWQQVKEFIKQLRSK